MNYRKIKKFEKIFKGVGNHWRVRILLIINDKDKINLEEIVKNVKGNYQTISEHVRTLEKNGLIYKKYKGKHIQHSISPYGNKIIKFIKSF